jgi:YHS domain-containing protein
VRNIGIPAMLATLVLCVTAAWGATPQTDCPITGKKVDKSIHVDYEGKRVYFCSLTPLHALVTHAQHYLSAHG